MFNWPDQSIDSAFNSDFRIDCLKTCSFACHLFPNFQSSFAFQVPCSLTLVRIPKTAMLDEEGQEEEDKQGERVQSQ